jgi:RNA polymerase sigma factor (sigma-70 family)
MRSSTPMTDSGQDEGFDQMIARLKDGDASAEPIVFRRYVQRLIVLAAGQFDEWMRDRADVKNVVLSAYRSFFRRNERGEFDLAGWQELWSLLAVITLRKCTKRRKFLRAARRDIRREVDWADASDVTAWLADRAPTPDEAVVLTETIELLFQAMTPGDRPIIELILMGCTTEEVARQLDASVRTVQRVRQRARRRLEQLDEARGGDGEAG